MEEIENSTFLVDELLTKAERSERPSERAELAAQAHNIARSIRYDGGLVRASLILGRAGLQDRKIEEAFQYLLEAETKSQASGNTITLTAAYRALGDLFYTEKLYANAFRYYRQIVDINPKDYAAMEKAADAGLADMQFDTAEYYYKKLLLKSKSEGDYARQVQIYQKLANAYDAHGNPDKSLYNYLFIEDIIERYGTLAEKAMLYNNMGKQYASVLDYKKALEYFRKAELQCGYIPCDYPEVLYANLGLALHNTGNDKEALNYLLKARYIVNDQKDRVSLAGLEHLIAGVYYNAKDYYNALSHNEVSIRLAAETGRKSLQADGCLTAADVYHDLYDFEKAYEYYKQYLILIDSVRLEEQSRRQRINQQRTLLTSAEGQIRYLITRQNIKDLELQKKESEAERYKLLNQNLTLENERRDNELRLLQKQKEIDQARERELILQNLQARQAQRLALNQLETEKQRGLIFDLRRQEHERQADSTRRAQEIKILQRDRELSHLQLRQQDSFRRFAYGLGGLGLVILGLLGAGWLYARRSGRRLAQQNRKIEAQKTLIEEERMKSDRLLLNILPEEIAQELRTRGQASPRHYESATVVFTDFVKFTRLSAQLTPEQLINTLDECFLAFDEICDKHRLEKIKTIGDAYMCAAGIPVPNSTHPVDAVTAALEMMKWLHERNVKQPDVPALLMRIGIHTGPVVAGVIGKNKFAYDIWGDAVNLAARLEELGEPGRINISGATYEAVKHHFTCESRGEKEVHNKGRVGMYFIV